MSLTLRILMIAFCLIFLFVVLRLVAKGKLQLKYSLLWVVLTLTLLICSIFPQIVVFLSDLFGFDKPSNFIFVVGFFLLMTLVLSLSIIVSWQSQYIRSLVQTVALLKKDIAEAENKDDMLDMSRDKDSASRVVIGGEETG